MGWGKTWMGSSELRGSHEGGRGRHACPPPNNLQASLRLHLPSALPVTSHPPPPSGKFLLTELTSTSLHFPQTDIHCPVGNFPTNVSRD